MHYSYAVTVLTTETVDNYNLKVIKLGSGILKRVEIVFPLGCAYTIRSQLWSSANQVLPTNPDGYYSLDGDKVVADLHYDLDVHGNTLYLVSWTTGSSYDHGLTVHLEVQGVDEPDVTKLQDKMIETINRLIDLCKSFF